MVFNGYRGLEVIMPEEEVPVLKESLGVREKEVVRCKVLKKTTQVEGSAWERVATALP